MTEFERKILGYCALEPYMTVTDAIKVLDIIEDWRTYGVSLKDSRERLSLYFSSDIVSQLLTELDNY